MLLAKLDYCISGTEAAYEAYQQAFIRVVSDQKPGCFRGSEAITLSMEKGYGKLLVALAESGCSNVDSLTVFALYSWLDSLEEKYEAQKQALRKHAPKR